MSKTPYRISLFGGGSDYPSWYEENEGFTIGGAINKYCYLCVHKKPNFFDHKYRMVYSIIEKTHDLQSLNHPAIKGVLSYMGFNEGIEIHHIGDLPAMSGMGTSSAFTVGLINAMAKLHGKDLSSQELFEKSIHVEQNVIAEAVGSQDQAFSSFGGFNSINFSKDKITVDKINNKEAIADLDKNLMLFFTGVSRNSTVNATKIIKNLNKNKENIKHLVNLAKYAKDVIEEQKDLNQIGEMLAESWDRKKELADTIVVPEIDDLYKKAVKAGAIGGKVLGAGGGGFVLLYVNKDKQEEVREALSSYLEIDFKFTGRASEIILNSGGYE